MKKNTPLLLTGVTFIIGILTIFLNSVSQLACEGQLLYAHLITEDQQIFGDVSLGQRFTASQNGLRQIDILFQTFGEPTAEVNLTLWEVTPDLATPEKIATDVFQAETISFGQAWYSFEFPIIENSATKHYLFTVQSQESVKGNALVVTGVPKDVYAAGVAVAGPIELHADLAFRACFEQSIFSRFQTLAIKLTQYRPSLWNFSYFYIVLLGGYFGIMVKLVLHLGKISSKK